MIFITFEPYEDDINTQNTYNENNERIICFVCYEYYDDINELPIKLNNNYHYIKNCECNVIIHKSCLDKWYSINNSCPICRDIMSINNINSYTILDYYNKLSIINILFIYVFKLNQIIHFLYIIKTLYYLLNKLVYIVRIYILLSLLYMLSFIFVIFIRDILL